MSSMNLNEQLLLQETMEKLVSDNKMLREELARYKPEISIELNYDNRSIDASLKQNGKVVYFAFNKDQIDYYSVEDKINILAEELGVIYLERLKDEIRNKVIAIQNNIDTLKGVK